MAPAGGEKTKDEGFVLLEETEAIKAKMQQQQQQQGRVEGEAPVVEYELASFRRTLSSACEDDTVYSDEDENEVDLDDLSLEDMPTDLQGLCRRLRAQSLALAAEESKQANKGKGKGKGEVKVEEETSEEEQEERRRRRRERRQQERRRLQLKQAQEEGRGIHGFLRFAWPIGTREFLFWALLVVFMTTLVSLSGGQHTRAAVNSTVGRGGGGRGTNVMGGGGREGGVLPTPLFVFDDVATAVAAAAAFQQHCPSSLSSLPSYQQQGETKETRNLSPYTEIALLQGQLRAQVSLAQDREEELKWMRVQQQQLEGKVEVLSKTVEGLQMELCLARRGGKEGGREGGVEVGVEKEGPLTLNVVPEVCTVKEGGREGGTEGVMWWWGANWNGYVARAREAVMSLKEGGREGGVRCPTITISPGRFTVLGEDEEEDEEWWSDEETDDEWWSDEEDDSDWSDEDGDDEDEDEDDFWWSDAEWEDEDEDEREEGGEVLPTPPPMSPFVKPVTAQRWDEMASGGREEGRGACHTACAAPHWFAASQKRGGRGGGVVETEGMCAVQSGWGLF